MSAWFAEIAIGIGASFAATLLVKATLTLAVALAVTGLARRSRAAARHVLLVAAFAVLLALPAASFVMPSRGVTLPAPPAASSAPVTAVVPVMTSPSPTRVDAHESVDTFRIESRHDRVRASVDNLGRRRVALSAASARRDVALARAASIRLVVRPRRRVVAQAVARGGTASVYCRAGARIDSWSDDIRHASAGDPVAARRRDLERR